MKKTCDLQLQSNILSIYGVLEQSQSPEGTVNELTYFFLYVEIVQMCTCAVYAEMCKPLRYHEGESILRMQPGEFPSEFCGEFPFRGTERVNNQTVFSYTHFK